MTRLSTARGLMRVRGMRRVWKSTMKLVETVSRLAPVTGLKLARKPAPKRVAARPQAGFSTVEAFGSNPGALAMHVYLPRRLKPLAPLVVVLHGCGEQARDFAKDTGWMAMADRLGLVLVLPEQSAANNHGRCFSWYRPGDIARGSGEVLSIRQMVATARRLAGNGGRRVFVVGLSAGGSMAAACLAAYPEVFTAGAVVAGLPVAAASNLASAMGRMAHAGSDLGPEHWAAMARASAPAHTGKYPRLSVWQGDADRTVDPANAGNLVAQWRGLAALGAEPRVDETRDGPRHRAWRGAAGQVFVEEWTIPGMAHGYPVKAGVFADRFVLAVGIDATAAIARFWGLAA